MRFLTRDNAATFGPVFDEASAPEGIRVPLGRELNTHSLSVDPDLSHDVRNVSGLVT